jgi:hypothetical protein
VIVKKLAHLTTPIPSGGRLSERKPAFAFATASSTLSKSRVDLAKRLVRHGHLPEREIMTGIGPVGVRCPRVKALSLVREPDAGNLPVRFDERDVETESWSNH